MIQENFSIDNENVDEGSDANHPSDDYQDPVDVSATHAETHTAPMHEDRGNQLDTSQSDDIGINQEKSGTYPDTGMNKPNQPENIIQPEMHARSKQSDLSSTAWFVKDDVTEVQSRWKSIQSQFVDEPCSAVEQGEALVVETFERIKQMISDHQQEISEQWLNHDDISTEELRITLLNYRSLLYKMLKL